MNNYLFCTVSDFQPYIDNLPENTILIQCAEPRARFFFEDDDLALDCEAEIWARNRRRKYFRKVLYAHFGFQLSGGIREDYILYYICEPEK